jgi:hypothetical protein
MDAGTINARQRAYNVDPGPPARRRSNSWKRKE